MAEQTLPYRELLDYGFGIDRLDGSIKGLAFQDAAPSGVQGASGPRTTAEFNKVESFTSLSTALGIDANASARFGMFGADASFKFSESLSMNSYSLYVYAIATISLPFMQIRHPRFSAEAEALIRAGRTSEFRRAYGDWFVRGIRTGGALLSIVEMRTRDAVTRRRVDADLRGSYGINFSADVNVQSDFQKALSQTQAHVTHDQTGGSPRIINDANQVFHQMKEWLAEMADARSESAVPYRVGIVGYETVPTEASPTWVEVVQAEELLTDLAARRVKHLHLKADVDYVLLNQDEFLWENRQEGWVDKLNGLVAVLDSNLERIRRAASQQSRDASATPSLTLDEVPPYALPTRVETAGKLAPAEESTRSATAGERSKRDKIPQSWKAFDPGPLLSTFGDEEK